MQILYHIYIEIQPFDKNSFMIKMRNDNNKGNQLITLVLILFLLPTSIDAIPTKHSNSIEDLTNFTMHHQ